MRELTWENINGSTYSVASVTHNDILLVESASPVSVFLFTDRTSFNGGYQGRDVKPRSADYVIPQGYRGLFFYAGSSSVFIQIWGYYDNDLVNAFVNAYRVYTVGSPHGRKDNQTIIVTVSDEENIINTLIPVYALGTRYIIALCPYISTDFVLATHALRAVVRITIKTTGNVTYDGVTYVNGDTLQVNLNPYQTLTVDNIVDDVTGTVVESDNTIAVFIGSSSDDDLPSLEQLPPVTKFGREFVLALDYKEEYQLKVVADQDDTRLVFNDGTEATISSGSYYEHRLYLGGALVFSTRPVFCWVCHDSFVTPVPPTSLLPKKGFFHDSNETLIISKTPEDVTVTGPGVTTRVTWRTIYGSTYSVASVTHKDLLLVESSSPLSVVSVVYFEEFTFILGGGYNWRGNTQVARRHSDGQLWSSVAD